MTSAAERPLISVGLPVYNGERFLAVLLESVLAQSYENFELIISDNASTDGTVAICDHYARRDSRIAVHRAEQNQGSAWNHGRVRDLATGPFFKWLGADDAMEPRFLERTLETLLAKPEAVNAYPLTIVIDDDGVEVTRTTERLPLDSADPVERFAALLRPFSVTQCMFYGLFRKSLMIKARPMGAFLAADRCMLAELALYGPYFRVEEPLMLRRIHAAHKTRTRDVEQKLYVPNSAKLQLREFGVLRESMMSVMHAPVDAATRLRLLRAIAAWAGNERGNFYVETKELLKHTLRMAT
jgi:glycosyltransferase involved in cell wall biosynthesis